MKSRINYHKDRWHVHGASYATETVAERHVQRFVCHTFDPSIPNSLDKLIEQTQDLINNTLPGLKGKFDVRKWRKGGHVGAPWKDTYCMGVYYQTGKRWVICVSEPHDLRKDYKSPFPEHDKFDLNKQLAAKGLLDWITDQGYTITLWDPEVREYRPAGVPRKERLVAQYLGIDYDALVTEQRKMMSGLLGQKGGQQ